MRTIVLFFLLTMAGTVVAQKRETAKNNSAQEIVFKTTKWAAVAAEAKKSGQYIFVDAYTSWCGPCKLLKATTFKDKDAVAYFNSHFINYTADMEQGEGIGLAEKWNVTAYPALLFFTPEGKMVLKQVGYVDGKKLVEIGQQALAKQ
ncbi:thioredoxin family protein [Parapedobacter koreensis]|uniref:Thioredoxin-like n=1 Tax=Parapedobacter koreensis TaxID=332977 RepID=A0A1H7MGH3_9SPHI|nr:thioredoxin family protein [Parapedobacter koreensis]SEL10440.1 Thioredoxin-like [Parapedobacter koreensis]